GSPPVMTIFAMSASARPGRFVGSEGAQRERMDLAAHALAQGRVDHAVAGQRQLAGGGGADDGGFEMHAVVATDVGRGAGQAGLDQLADGFGIHGSVAEGPAAAGAGQTLEWRHSNPRRSEEHTSELQSRENLVCR